MTNLKQIVWPMYYISPSHHSVISLLLYLRCETVFALYLPLILRTIFQVDLRVVLLLSIDTYCCQLARLFSRHVRLALARAILKLIRFSEVIFVLKLAKADFQAFLASLHSVLNQGLQSFFCFAVVFGIQLLAIIHKTSILFSVIKSSILLFLSQPQVML